MTLTLEQIAKLAGVSRSSASRVINERPGVRPEVRKRVWQIIHEHSYRPNPAARSLASRRATVTEGDQPTARQDRDLEGSA